MELLNLNPIPEPDSNFASEGSQPVTIYNLPNKLYSPLTTPILLKENQKKIKNLIPDAKRLVDTKHSYRIKGVTLTYD